MEITDIRVFGVGEDKLKGYVTIPIVDLENPAELQCHQFEFGRMVLTTQVYRDRLIVVSSGA